jgi:ERCC4-type nuclease
MRRTLPTGDYSIVGLEDLIAIERKTLPDLIGCLCNGRERFERELSRGKALDYFAVIIEASLTDIVNGNYRSQMTPKSAIQSIMAFSVRYRLPVFFVENRSYGARVVESLLLKYVREVEKRAEAVQK